MVSVDGKILHNGADMLSLHRKILTVSKAKNVLPTCSPSTPNFKFVDLECGNKKYTVLISKNESDDLKLAVHGHIKYLFKTDKFSVTGSFSNGQTLKVKLS